MPSLMNNNPDCFLRTVELLVNVKCLQFQKFNINIQFILIDTVRSVQDKPTNPIPYPLGMPGVFIVPPVPHEDMRADHAVGGTTIEISGDADEPCRGENFRGVVDRQKNVDPAPIPIEAIGVCHHPSREALEIKLFS